MRAPAAIALPPRPEDLEAVPAPVIADTIERLLDALDRREGDPDMESIDECEPDGDETDLAWIEWHTMRGSQKRGPNIVGDHEDDEDDDPAEDDDSDTGVDDQPHDGHNEDGY